ncbi:MAG TPA: contractile injection system protein, VgrG/Pvc8 family [Burkholderiaceae bacterium]|nr:contractile injection system protein, VgrG/Pvc8 family [Burkholderiaceae bacterium]
MCQEWGISYHFRHSDGKHRLVLTDNMGAQRKGPSRSPPHRTSAGSKEHPNRQLCLQRQRATHRCPQPAHSPAVVPRCRGQRQDRAPSLPDRRRGQAERPAVDGRLAASLRRAGQPHPDHAP